MLYRLSTKRVFHHVRNARRERESRGAPSRDADVRSIDDILAAARASRSSRSFVYRGAPSRRPRTISFSPRARRTAEPPSVRPDERLVADPVSAVAGGVYTMRLRVAAASAAKSLERSADPDPNPDPDPSGAATNPVPFRAAAVVVRDEPEPDLARRAALVEAEAADPGPEAAVAAAVPAATRWKRRMRFSGSFSASRSFRRCSCLRSLARLR